MALLGTNSVLKSEIATDIRIMYAQSHYSPSEDHFCRYHLCAPVGSLAYYHSRADNTVLHFHVVSNLVSVAEETSRRDYGHCAEDTADSR